MAGAPYADAADVAARWRTLTPAETTVSTTLIDDASSMVRSRWADVDARVAAGTLAAEDVRRVVAGMVKRAMVAGQVDGVESQSQTAGPFGVTQKFANPQGNLYFTSEDVRLFNGTPKRRAFAVDMAAAPTGRDWPQ